MTFELERRRAEIERHQQNAARLARAYAKFKTLGQGSMEFAEYVDFGLTFIEEPFVSYGVQLDLDVLGELLETEPGSTPPLPLSQGFVTAWDQDDRDFYIGCWLAARVAFPTDVVVDPEVEVELNHHFTFEAIAIKDVPMDIRD